MEVARPANPPLREALARIDAASIVVAACNLLFAAGWARLHGPVLRWLWRTFTGEGYRLNLGLLLAAVVLLGQGALRDLRGASMRGLLARRPALRIAPLALATASATGYLLVERLLDIDILSAALFGLGTWGAIGLYVSPARFRRGLVAALLLVAVLPFGEQANTYLGFAARAATARAVAGILDALHLVTLRAETILFLENGVAHVDVPCSGVRSLWIGAVFFLAATVVERRRADARWALAGAALLAALLAANVARVTAIVLLAVVLGQHALASIAHAPLGVVGFAAACAIALLLLRGARPIFACETSPPAVVHAPRALPIALAAGAWLLAALYVARPPSPPLPPLSLRFPPSVTTTALALTPAEADLFSRFAGGAADKRRVELGPHRGTLLVAWSRSFRAHHPPEICLAGAGFHVDSLDEVRLAGAPVRLASLDGGARTALYWYQSPSGITADLLSRIAAGITGREQGWAQVTLLLEEPPAWVVAEGAPLLHLVREAVAAALPGGPR